MSNEFNDIQVPTNLTNVGMSDATPAGALTTTIVDGVISAKRVDVKRDIAGIMTNIKASACVMGEKYYYHWETKNRDGSKGKVEGGTVKLALDIARLYGNCQVDCRAQDCGTHLEFHARFVDIESGFSLTRPFRQRKDQNTGMKDKGRAEDIMLQIGASKAIRNVILNSLPTLAEYAMQEAKKGLLSRVAKNPDGARNAILDTIKEINLPLTRVEKIVGRNAANWTNADMAKLYVQVESIKDNYATVDDIFPSGEPETIAVSGNEAAKQSLKKKAVAPTPPVVPEEERKPEPEPEPIDLVMLNGEVKNFPKDIETIELMSIIQDLGDEQLKEFMRNNIGALPKVINLMADKPLAAESLKKFMEAI